MAIYAVYREVRDLLSDDEWNKLFDDIREIVETIRDGLKPNNNV